MSENQEPRPYIIVDHIGWILLPLILAVLTAVLAPYVARHRESVRQKTCLSNMKAIALSVRMYAQEHDGFLPPGPDWIAQMQGYVKSRRLLRCPSDNAPISYVLNPDLFGRRPDAVGDPGLTVLLYEGRSGTVIEWHNGGANYVFADGRAEWAEEAPEGLDVAVADP